MFLYNIPSWFHSMLLFLIRIRQISERDNSEDYESDADIDNEEIIMRCDSL